VREILNSVIVNDKTLKKKKMDKLIAENQKVGDGAGFYCVSNLYEKPNGTRYSVIIQPWKWIEQKVAK